jgi:ADP-L-glycero-D-manno-heptose 6-epimerase
MTIHPSTIIVTGAAGFIGSCMAGYLNKVGYHHLILVDDFGVEAKRKNWEGKIYDHIVERASLFEWLSRTETNIDACIHLGARTDTTEFDYSVHEALNLEYSKQIWDYCTAKNIPLIYASSAATYGAGENGYNDAHETVAVLKPLNPYGVSKNEFDKWALAQKDAPSSWTGLKFFNVYGPGEYHKGRMASVIFHAFNQIKQTGKVQLFKSHKPDFKDGEQLRDFIYVKDVVAVIGWMLETMLQNNWISVNDGLYNLGTGEARSFIDLVRATFAGLDLEPNIHFIDMPLDIRDTYQYFTEASMEKLKAAGYKTGFTSLEDGVQDYVAHYLQKGLIY